MLACTLQSVAILLKESLDWFQDQAELVQTLLSDEIQK